MDPKWWPKQKGRGGNLVLSERLKLDHVSWLVLSLGATETDTPRGPLLSNCHLFTKTPHVATWIHSSRTDTFSFPRMRRGQVQVFFLFSPPGRGKCVNALSTCDGETETSRLEVTTAEETSASASASESVWLCLCFPTSHQSPLRFAMRRLPVLAFAFASPLHLLPLPFIFYLQITNIETPQLFSSPNFMPKFQNLNLALITKHFFAS